MPTIEIVSLECERLLPIKNSTLPFFVRQNTKLISHRSLFQKILDNENGKILHLGNKEFGRNGYFCGSELIDWAAEIKNESLMKEFGNKNIQEDFQPFRFESSMFDSIKKCFFYTDIQTNSEYGKENDLGYGKINFEDFINKQNNEYYIFNTLYEIYK